MLDDGGGLMYLPDQYSQDPNGTAFIPYSVSIFMMGEGWCTYQINTPRILMEQPLFPTV